MEIFAWIVLLHVLVFKILINASLIQENSSPWYNRASWLGVKHQLITTTQENSVMNAAEHLLF